METKEHEEKKKSASRYWMKLETLQKSYGHELSKIENLKMNRPSESLLFKAKRDRSY